MKKSSANSRKFRYGGVTAALTALIIVVIILFNVIFTALSRKFLWVVDMTPDFLYTLSDECKNLIRDGDEKFETSSPIEMVEKTRESNKAKNAENGLVKGDEGYLDEDITINIIFCDDIDVLEEESTQRYVYNTALELQKEFPDYINVINYNIIRNPSAVSKYKVTSTSTVSTTSVIVEFGTEFRVFHLKNFYTFNENDNTTPWAYNGEKKFTAGILAVTRAESPVACITVNHGEAMKDPSLINTLVDAGYIIQELDLATQDIPKDCRLMVVFNPNSDFLVKDGISDVDEIEKLDAYLDGTNSMMVFMSPDSPVLKNFESYLEEWGISYNRTPDNYPYLVKDSSQSITSDGFTLVSEYVTQGMGASVTSEMRNVPFPKKVIFPQAMSISYSDVYKPSHYVDEKDKTIEYDYGHYFSNGVSRSIYDLFVTSENAVAHANGAEVAKATKENPLKLMTITKEDRTTQESNYTTVSEASFVVACGTTDFASKELIESSYGNSDFLLSVCRAIGREPVPVGLEFKPFADYTIDNITTAQTTQYTVVLALVPALIATVTGAVVLIRRKNK